MDPQATLNELLEAVADRDWDRVDELADSLHGWLQKGGFPPPTLGPENLSRGWHRAVAAFLCRLAKAKARTARERRNRRWEQS
jgi:hypothetical protein